MTELPDGWHWHKVSTPNTAIYNLYSDQLGSGLYLGVAWADEWGSCCRVAATLQKELVQLAHTMDPMRQQVRFLDQSLEYAKGKLVERLIPLMCLRRMGVSHD